MPLDNLKPAWKAFVAHNSLHRLSENEVLSIIESSRSSDTANLQRVFANAVLFLLLLMSCQGG